MSRKAPTNFIHYIGITSMSAPDLAVPRQFATTRTVQAGDAVVAEISATFWDHPGQVLRSLRWAKPTQLYRELHAAADAAFDAIAAVLKAGATPAQVIEASGVIEKPASPSSTICCTAMAAAICRRSSAARAARPARCRRSRSAPGRSW